MRIKPLSKGRTRLELDPHDASYLLRLPARLERLLANPDFTERAIQRILPRGYLDEQQEAEYRELVGEELRQKKLDNITEFRRTISEAQVKRDAVQITLQAEDFEVWLGFLNDMRLFIGTELDIQDNRDLPMSAEDLSEEQFVYEYLTYLQASLIQADGYEFPDLGEDDP